MNSYERVYECILESFRKPNIGGVHPSHYTKKGLKTAGEEERLRRTFSREGTPLGIAKKRKQASMSAKEHENQKIRNQMKAMGIDPDWEG